MIATRQNFAKATVARILFAAALIGAAYGIRAPALDRDVWNLDEGSTLTMGQQVLEGDVLYRDAADNRAPLVPFLKAAIFAVAGDWNGRAVHVTLALALGALAVLLWLIARRLGDEPAGIGAAVFCTALSFVLPGQLDTMTTHTGWFVVLFSTLGYLVFARQAPRDGGFGAGALAGSMFGLAALCKQPGLLDLGVTWVLSGLLAWQQPSDRARLLRFVAGEIAAVAALFALTFLYFFLHGALRDFVFYAWTYNTHYYIPEVALAERLAAVRVPFLLAWQHLPLALVGGLAAALFLFVRAVLSLARRRVPDSLFVWLILGWTGAGLVSTMLSGRDFSHYSLQVIPGLSLACGWLAARVWEAAWRQRRLRRFAVPLVALAFAAALASMAEAMIRRQRALHPQDDVAKQVGQMVQQVTSPGERIFVWGYMPELYYFSQRLPSSRFIYTNYATGLIPWTNLDPLRDTAYASVPGSWERMWADLEARPPAVIIDTGTARGYAKYPFARQSWLWRYTRRHYAALDAPFVKSNGIQVYRRLAEVEPDAVAADLPVNPRIALSGRTLTGREGEIPTITVAVPAGSTAVDVYRDGLLYRRLAHPPPAGADVTFFVETAASNRPNVEFRALLRQEGRTVLSHPYSMGNYAAPAYLQPGDTAAGPVMALSDRFSAPQSATAGGEPLPTTSPRRSWTGPAPARFVYPRLRNMSALRFDIHASAPPSGGDDSTVLLSIAFAGMNGRTEALYQQKLDPTASESVRVNLPRLDPGDVIVEIAPGASGEDSSVPVTIDSVRAQGLGPDLIIDDGRIFVPETSETLFDGQLVSGDGRQWPAHAPTSLTYLLPADIMSVTVRFGLQEDAYVDANGNRRGDGIGLVARFESAGGLETLLVRRMLRPYENPEDRGPQAEKLTLPEGHLGGRLRVELTTGPGSDSSFDWSYFLNFTGTTGR